MSASFRASASLTPSPDQGPFLFGRHPAEHRGAGGDLDQLGRIGAEGTGVDHTFHGVGVHIETDRLGDGSDGLRIVAGDHLDGHPLLGEVAQGLGSIRPDLLGESDQRLRHQIGRQHRLIQRPGAAAGQQDHPAAGAGECRHPGP